ncbi:SGNH hydrolase domain-containing protein [Achromobacter mucicolens]|uniref:SGNH hydrolase domain-containing protein n=1 Tax=Achromobacter mucicolens TaxID=1389922 RepID=UPI0039F0BE80
MGDERIHLIKSIDRQRQRLRCVSGEAKQCIFVDVRNIFCIDGCLFYGGGKYSYFDSSHWTQSGADRFFDNLRKTDLYQAMVRR